MDSIGLVGMASHAGLNVVDHLAEGPLTSIVTAPALMACMD